MRITKVSRAPLAPKHTLSKPMHGSTPFAGLQIHVCMARAVWVLWVMCGVCVVGGVRAVCCAHAVWGARCVWCVGFMVRVRARCVVCVTAERAFLSKQFIHMPKCNKNWGKFGQ